MIVSTLVVTAMVINLVFCNEEASPNLKEHPPAEKQKQGIFIPGIPVGSGLGNLGAGGGLGNLGGGYLPEQHPYGGGLAGLGGGGLLGNGGLYGSYGGVGGSYGGLGGAEQHGLGGFGGYANPYSGYGGGLSNVLGLGNLGANGALAGRK
ncbi:hypothetical protein AAVH_07309 [Aphelenchoides avenae]|nr:hypothetical protein AAVH_07309 [Aphelenchus avenae]